MDRVMDRNFFEHKRRLSIEDWKKEMCSSGLKNEDIVSIFYKRLTNIIQNKKLKNNWEEFEVKEIIDSENIQDKLVKIFYNLS